MTQEDATTRAVRDACILAHVSLYRLTLLRVVERLFFGVEAFPDREQARRRAGDALSALVRQQKLAVHSFPGGERYFTLRAAKPVNTQAIDYDLAALWICCLGEMRCYRLETAEMRRLFETPPHHHVRHCLSEELDGPVVYRIYPTTVDVKTTLNYLRKHLADARRRYGLSDWIDAGDYGFLIATDSSRKATQLAEAVCRTPPNGGQSLVQQARLIVTVVPSSSTIAKV